MSEKFYVVGVKNTNLTMSLLCYPKQGGSVMTTVDLEYAKAMQDLKNNRHLTDSYKVYELKEVKE